MIKNKKHPEQELSEPAAAPRRKLLKHATKLALAASVAAGGAAMYHKADQAAKDAKAATEYARTVETQLADVRRTASERHDKVQGELQIQKEMTGYLTGLSGIDIRKAAEHASYPALPEVSGQFSPEIAKKQDDATLYIFSLNAHSPLDDSAQLYFKCTAFKTGANMLTGAAHCFTDVYREGPQKGGGENPVSPKGFITEDYYYVSDQPTLTLGEARQSAMRVTGFNADYVSSDTAILRVDSLGEQAGWFEAIQPLTAMDSVPKAGSLARVAGYPNGSDKPVAAEGVVLGQMPPSLVGFHYPSDFTIVGINADVYDDYTCSFGSSGSTMVNQDGEWFGSLGYIGRSNKPENQPAVTPDADQLMQMEELFKTKLVGENYILCGFAPAVPDMEPLPLTVGDTDAYERK